MALTAVLGRDPERVERVRDALGDRWHDVMAVPTWAGLVRQLQERPVSVLVVDLVSAPSDRAPARIEGLARRFPSIPIGAAASAREPLLLHELGRSGLRHLHVVEEGGPRVLARWLRGLLAVATPGRVASTLSTLLGRPELEVVRAALELVHRCPSADEFAGSFGISRTHLSRRLTSAQLPSTGRLLVWARLMMAGAWLADPGRSGDGVARQLEYANGSTFRRALRTRVEATPTEVAEAGGLEPVVKALVARSGLAERLPARQWVA